MALGEKISELRKQRGWTQEMLGEKAGVHTNHVSRWECNRIRPSGKALRRLAAAFNVTYDELLENEQPPVPDGIMDDPELVDRFRQLQQLEPEDQAVLFRLLDLMSRHRQVARLMSGKD